MVKRGLLVALGAALLVSAVMTGAGASSVARPRPVTPVVPSLEPAATEALWQALVRRPRPMRAQGECRALRGVFYAATDWLRLATKLAATASPCAQYYVSVPPIVGNKTAFRTDQAWRIRALGSNFHALAELHWTTWSKWVADNGSSWYEAGIEARRRMAEAGFDFAAGDTWAVNELPSTVRIGAGSARQNARDLVRGLYEGDGSRRTRGVVFVVGIGQQTNNVSVYQTNVQNWLADQAFWADMNAYVSDWSQEVYGDYRRYAVPGAPVTTRRDYLNDYLQHAGVVAYAGPPTVEPARAYLRSAFSPVANAAWQWDSGYGWTAVPVDQMQAYVSSQVYALRSFSTSAGLPQDHWGFAWQPRNGSALPTGDFTAQSGAILDRLAAAIRDSGQPGDPNDPGAGACGPPGQNVYCGGDLEGAQFNELWKSFRTWSEPVLTFSTLPQTLTAGAPSTPFGLALATSAGAPQAATVPVTVTLRSSSQHGRFSLASTGPWTETLALTIPAGASVSPPFYYADTRAAQLQLSASAAGATTATQAATVGPGAAAALRLDPVSATVAAYGRQSFSATAVDAFGNAISSAQARWAVTPATLAIPAVGPASSTTVTAGGRGGSGRLAATLDGGIAGTAKLTIEPGTIRVRSIRYERRPRVLRVTATVLETRGEPARAVRTSVMVKRNGREVFSGRKRTDRDGAVTFVVPLEKGCYRTAVTDVTGPGYAWNGKTPANRYCTPRL